MSAQRDGYVLIAALWIVVAISTLTLQTGMENRYQRLHIRNAGDAAHARQAARAALAQARAELTDLLRVDPFSEQARDPWYSMPAHVTGSLGDWSYQASVTDAESLLNVNTATLEQLERFLRASGVGQAAATALAIVDMRNDRRIQSVAELQALDTVSVGVYAALKEHVTTSGAGRINLNTAGPAVLMSLPKVTDVVVSTIMRMRASGERIHSVFEVVSQLAHDERAALSAVLPQLETLTTVETRYALVRATASSTRSVMRAQLHAELVREGQRVRLVSAELS